MIKFLDLILRLITGNKPKTSWRTFGRRRT